MFQSHKVNDAIENGLIYTGNFKVICIQLAAAIATVVFSAIVTYMIARVIKSFTPLATTEEEDKTGLDAIVHGEKAILWRIEQIQSPYEILKIIFKINTLTFISIKL